MRVKNISGSSRSFVFGSNAVAGVTPESLLLANNAEGTVSDRADIVTDAVRLQRAGLLDIIVPPENFGINEPCGKIVSVTLTDSTDGDIITISGVALTTLPLASTAIAAGDDLAAKINASTTLKALGVQARDAFVSGPNAVVLIELPTAVLAAAVTTNDNTNAAVATVQATDVAVEALKFFARRVVAAGTGLVIPTGLRDIRYLAITVLRGGVLTYVTSIVTTTGGVITFAANGATNLAASDVVHVVAHGTSNL